MSSPLGSTRCQNQVTNPKDGSVIISESKNAVRVKNRICESVDGKGWLDDIHGLTVISNIMPHRKIRTVDGCRWSCHASFFVLACSQPKVDRIRDQAGWLRSCLTLYLHAGIQRMQHHGTCSSVTWVPTVTRPNCRAKKEIYRRTNETAHATRLCASVVVRVGSSRTSRLSSHK